MLRYCIRNKLSILFICPGSRYDHTAFFLIYRYPRKGTGEQTRPVRIRVESRFREEVPGLRIHDRSIFRIGMISRAVNRAHVAADALSRIHRNGELSEGRFRLFADLAGHRFVVHHGDLLFLRASHFSTS